MRSAASPRRSPLWDAFQPRPSPTRARLPGNSPSTRKLSAIVGRDLAQQQQSLDFALERRRNSLQALIGDISGRSEAFEATLGRFAANVEDSFARSQARAQEISAALAAATRGASIAVAGQFETIRDTAAKERERTAQTLQATLEQTNAQLTGALDHAADRFRQSVAEVKDMASQVQRELDQTRQELRRGVLDLPQETSETAEAMRRVVSDQIRALKELAALVSDSGATYDVVEPSRGRRAVAGARFEKPLLRAVERAREVEAPSQSEALSRASLKRLPRLRPRARTSGRIGASELSPPFARAQTQSWPASSAAAPRPARRRRPRLRRRLPIVGSPDGFRTCLRPPPATSPRRPRSKGAETLEALNREIASLIDNAAAVEMWDRWRRGDTGAVSRRLYTEAGQQAFDELRRRFRADPSSGKRRPAICRSSSAC